MKKDSILVGYWMADGTSGTVQAPRTGTQWIGLRRWRVYDLSVLPQGKLCTLAPPRSRRIRLDVPSDRLAVRTG